MTVWDEKYAGAEFLYGTEPNDCLRDHALSIPRHGRVLSLGEGEGRNAVHLAELGYSVLALDQSAVGLRKARELATSRGVQIETRVANLEQFPLEDVQWDGIVSIWCHLPSKSRARLYPKIARALKPGGLVILEAYTPQQLKFGTGGPKDVDLMPTLEELRTSFAILEPLHAVEIERQVHEGTGHRGMSAVVQWVARRRD